MNRERLEDLAALSDEVHAAGAPFSMSSWAEGEDCGTAACVAGWACRSKKFQKQGLHLHHNYDLRLGDFWVPSFGQLYSLACLAKFFEISDSETKFIFVDRNPSCTAADVAARVRQLLAGEWQDG